jgi:hypothetical protein
MNYLRPNYLDHFYCLGESCPAPYAAPADTLWTESLGDFCETGISLACPQAAHLILSQKKTAFIPQKDNTPGIPMESPSREQLLLMLDARKTMDILLQDRSMPIRSSLVLALTYGTEFDPMISTDARYAYEELDWGFTEQPHRQLSTLMQFQGNWELKRSDLMNLLIGFLELCDKDTVLKEHLKRTIDVFEPMSGREYELGRAEFDTFMASRAGLLENLLVYYNHRYFLSTASELTVLPGITLMAVSFTVLHAMAARLYLETGSLTDEAFISLCWHYARTIEEDPEHRAILLQRFREDALYSRDRLQRLLWN